MAYSSTSKKLAFTNAEQFKESFMEYENYTPSQAASEYEPTLIGYVFIGNDLVWNANDSPVQIYDTNADQRKVWDHMYAAKRITGNDIELVTRRVNWTSNTKYRQYDDTIDFGELISANGYQNLEGIYIINQYGEVFKCLANNKGQVSISEPSGDNFTSNGVIQTADNYIWKYMYKVGLNNKFLTDDWMPAPISVTQVDYNTSNLIPIDGELTTIQIQNSGYGYEYRNVNVAAFSTGCTVLTITDSIITLDSNCVNMGILGTGIDSTNYIVALDLTSEFIRTITLKNPTISSSNGQQTCNVYTRASIVGDGSGAYAKIALNGNGEVFFVNVTSYGTNYSWANVFIYGTGSDAAARVILPPKYGHGFNPAKEIGASDVMISMRIGDVDSTEGGVISANTSLRQYGFLRNPHKYGSANVLSFSDSNTVISQTTDLTLTTGLEFNLNEFVYQGTSNTDFTFGGYVHDQTTNVVRLTNVRGKPLLGQQLKGSTVRSVLEIKEPYFEPYSGDILYTVNDDKIDRESGQAEHFRFIVKF